METPDKLFVHTGKLGLLCGSKINLTGDDTEYIRKDISNEAIQVAEDHAYFAGQEKFREKLLEWAKEKLSFCEEMIQKGEPGFEFNLSVYEKLIEKLNAL